MKWVRKNERYTNSYDLVARYCNHKLKVSYTSYHNYFYFLIDFPNGESYNSLWERLSFQTEQECIDACIKYIDKRKGV